MAAAWRGQTDSRALQPRPGIVREIDRKELWEGERERKRERERERES